MDEKVASIRCALWFFKSKWEDRIVEFDDYPYFINNNEIHPSLT